MGEPADIGQQDRAAGRRLQPEEAVLQRDTVAERIQPRRRCLKARVLRRGQVRRRKVFQPPAIAQDVQAAVAQDGEYPAARRSVARPELVRLAPDLDHAVLHGLFGQVAPLQHPLCDAQQPPALHVED